MVDEMLVALTILLLVGYSIFPTWILVLSLGHFEIFVI